MDGLSPQHKSVLYLRMSGLLLQRALHLDVNSTKTESHCFPSLYFSTQARIAKRDRKLVDYDSARHNYTTTHKTKKKDGGIKITKVSKMTFFTAVSGDK